MLWTDSLLFLHTPRCAGSSITRYLATELREKVSVIAPETLDLPTRAKRRAGNPYLTLVEAAAFFSSSGKGLHEFEMVISVLRDPYDLEVSLYHHLRASNDWVDRNTHDLALAGDVSRYLQGAGLTGGSSPRFERYYELVGANPPNMRIVAFEDIERAIPEITKQYRRDREPRLPHIEKGTHPSPEEFFDEQQEMQCRRRHAWFFARGYATPLWDRRTRPTASTEPEALIPMTDPDPLAKPFRLPASIRRQLNVGDENPSRVPIHEYVMAVIDEPSLASTRILGLDAGIDFVAPIFEEKLSVDSYVGIESRADLVAAINEHSPSRVVHTFAAEPLDVLFSDAPLFRSMAPFGLTVVRQTFTQLTADELARALTSLREVAADDGLLLFGVLLDETTLSGCGAADLLMKNVAPDKTPQPLGIVDTGTRRLSFLGRETVLEVCSAAGWRVERVLDPRPGFQHHVVCRADHAD